MSAPKADSISATNESSASEVPTNITAALAGLGLSIAKVTESALHTPVSVSHPYHSAPFSPSVPLALPVQPQRSHSSHSSSCSGPVLNLLEVHFPHVFRLVNAPPVRVGDSLIITPNQKLPGLLASLLLQRLKNTREWVKGEVTTWLKRSDGASPSRMFVILGSGGTGKSVISAMLVDQLLRGGVLVGAVHFCRFDDPAASAPEQLLSSLAAQFAVSIKGFEAAIDPKAVQTAREKGDIALLFEALFATPIRTALAAFDTLEDHDVVLVIDALDELPSSALRPFLNFLSEQFIALPPRVKLITTARDQADIKSTLDRFEPRSLLVDELRNRQDIRKFLSFIATDCVDLTMTIRDVAEKVGEKWAGIDISQISMLEDPLKSSKLCYDVAADRISLESGYNRLRGIQELQSDPPVKQALVGGVDGLDRDQVFRVLMADAGDARSFLRDLLADAWESEERQTDDAGEDRAKQKANNDYSGNYLELKDLARISLEFTGCEKLCDGFEELKRFPGVEIVGIKNKFANPTPMGYRDLNLSVRVTLQDGRRHICEVQMNHVDLLKAKRDAHKDYDKVRTQLPIICRSAAGGAKADDVEKFVMQLLQSSVLDSAVKSLEAKVGGLFIYARLLEEQLKEAQREAGGRLVDFSALKDLPAGLDEMYQSNFQRTFAEDGMWELCKEIVAMISVAREPLPECLVEKLIGGAEYYDRMRRATSLLFSTREKRLHVMHKSVVDWLVDEERKEQKFWISSLDKLLAHATLSRQLWQYEKWRRYDVLSHWDYEMEVGEQYAVTYGHVHLKETLLLNRLRGERAGWEGTVKARVVEWHNALLMRREGLADGAKGYSTCSSATATDSPQRSFSWLLRLSQQSSYQPKPPSVKNVRSAVSARAAGGLLIMSHAKMGRARRFTAEMRELQDELEKATSANPSCEKTLQLKLLIEDKVAVLGSKFNPAFEEIKKCMFERAAWDMMMYVPVTSALTRSEAGKVLIFSKTGDFTYDMTLPNRINHSPLVMALQGHTAGVTSLAFNSDGTQVVTGSWDKCVKIWNPITGEVFQTLRGHTDHVMSVAFNHDGKMVVSGGEDMKVNVWNVATGDLEQIMKGHSQTVTSVAFNNDGTRIVSGSKDNTVKIWIWDYTANKARAHGRLERTLQGHSDQVSSVTFNHDGSRIASGSWDKTVKIWHAFSGDLEETLGAYPEIVTSVAFSRDGTRFVSGRGEGLTIYDVVAGDFVQKFAHVDCCSNDSNSMVFNHDGSRVAYGCGNGFGTARIFNVETGDVERTLQVFPDGNGVTSLAYNPDGTQLVIGSDSKLVNIWKTATGNLDSCDKGHSGAIFFVAFSNDGTLIVSGSKDDSVKIWNATTGNLERTFEMFPKLYDRSGAPMHLGLLNCVALKRDGTQIAINGYSAEHTVSILNIATGRIDLTLRGHSGTVNSVDFNQDGTRIVSGSDDGYIKIWNSSTGKVERTFQGHSDSVHCVTFNRIGTRIVSGSGQMSLESKDNSVKVWNVATGNIEFILEGHSECVTSVAFNHDGSKIVSGSIEEIKIWNSATGVVERTLEARVERFWIGSRRMSVAFNNDGSQFVSTSGSAVTIWSVDTGDVEQVLEGHSSCVNSVAFSFDGSRIVSGSGIDEHDADNTVKVWNAVRSSKLAEADDSVVRAPDILDKDEVDFLESFEKNNDDVWTCKCCRKTYKSQAQYNQHLTSKKHTDTAKKAS